MEQPVRTGLDNMSKFVESNTCCGCMSHKLNLITERNQDEVIVPPESECQKPQMEFQF